MGQGSNAKTHNSTLFKTYSKNLTSIGPVSIVT